METKSVKDLEKKPKLGDDLKIEKKSGKLYFIDNTNKIQYLIWDKYPEIMSEEFLEKKEKQSAESEWNKESGKFEKFINVYDTAFNKLVNDWIRVGTTNYGSKKYGIKRPETRIECKMENINKDYWFVCLNCMENELDDDYDKYGPYSKICDCCGTTLTPHATLSEFFDNNEEEIDEYFGIY